jgi:hypothetical protein
MNIDYLEYNLIANTGSDLTYCLNIIINGCSNILALNYNAFANTDDESCEYGQEGCTDTSASNYNINASSDDGSCVSWEIVYLTLLENSEGNSCEPIIIDLEIGWNIFGYTSSVLGVDVVDKLQQKQDKVVIMKDNNGSFWQPSMGTYNSIGDFTPGEGYQIKVIEPFSITFDLGDCTDSEASNYNAYASIDDGSCVSWENAYLNLLEQGDGNSCEEIIIDFEVGWNIFGYTSSVNGLDVVDKLQDNQDKVVIMKDNNGSFWQPSMGTYNSIGDFTPGEGYQIKVTQPFSIFFEN